MKKRKRKDARDDFVLVRKKDQDGWLEFAFIGDRSIRLFVFEDEDGDPRWKGTVIREGTCYDEIDAKTYQGVFSKASKCVKKLPEPQDGQVKQIVKKIRRAGNKMPPHVQIGTGVIVAGVPIPEPVMETATDIAGVVMIRDGVERIRRGRWKEKLPGGLAAGMHPSDFDKEALKRGIEVELEHTDDRDIATEIAMDHLIEDSDYYEKLAVMESWPKRKVRKKSAKKKVKKVAKKSKKKKASKKISKAKLDTSHWDEYRLIKDCQKLWEHYCARPSKRRLNEVFDHLEKMKVSKVKSVASERRRCLRAANLEAKRLKLRR